MDGKRVIGNLSALQEEPYQWPLAEVNELRSSD